MSEPLPFKPLGQYAWPSAPVNHGVETLLSQFKQWLGRRDMSVGIDQTRLQIPSADFVNTVAEPPANHPLLEELTFALSHWVQSDTADTPHQMIVLPPCDREDLLHQWANAEGLPFFGLDRSFADLDEFDTNEASPVILSKLEHRFLRTRQGLIEVRLLLDRVSRMTRPVLIGCNSWAWQFLRKSCEIDLIFPDPLMFQAFDKTRIRRWLGTLAHSPEDTETFCFRSVSTGRDVFGNGEGEAEVSAFMTDLARRSHGIPWIAWHLWRMSLRVMDRDQASSDTEGALDRKPADGIETIWVMDLPAPTVPNRNDQNALLVLHSLLIHGGLTEDQIVQTVPLVSYTNVLTSLVRARLIDQIDGQYRCLPSAYPAIRDGLKNNSYPVDIL